MPRPTLIALLALGAATMTAIGLSRALPELFRGDVAEEIPAIVIEDPPREVSRNSSRRDETAAKPKAAARPHPGAQTPLPPAPPPAPATAPTPPQTVPQDPDGDDDDHDDDHDETDDGNGRDD